MENKEIKGIDIKNGKIGDDGECKFEDASRHEIENYEIYKLVIFFKKSLFHPYILKENKNLIISESTRNKLNAGSYTFELEDYKGQKINGFNYEIINKNTNYRITFEVKDDNPDFFEVDEFGFIN